MKSFFLILVLLSCSLVGKGQDSILSEIASDNKKVFYHKDDAFSGNVLDSLIDRVSRSRYVLIGEVHHTNEVLYFSKHLASTVDFDNYVMEGNLSVTELLKKRVLDPEGYADEILTQYSDNLGFYTFAPERLFTAGFLKEGKDVIELDQVFFNSDAPLLEELSRITKNQEALKVYRRLLEISNARWMAYKSNPIVSPPFDEEEIPLMYSREISEELRPVLQMDISENEIQIIGDIIKSNEIYALAIEGQGYESHKTRISLMKQNLLDNYGKLKGERSLFKFGANHVTKYRSMIQDTPDIGSLVYNLADAEGEESLHIAIIQKSGVSGSFFSDQEVSNGIPYLSVFSDLAEGREEWLLFDLNSMLEDIQQKDINVEEFRLRNVIEGYDYLIVIPEVTAQTKT